MFLLIIKDFIILTSTIAKYVTASQMFYNYAININIVKIQTYMNAQLVENKQQQDVELESPINLVF